MGINRQGVKQMTECNKTEKEVEEKASKYDRLLIRINESIKKYRKLARITRNEDYRLAYSMLADYLQEIKK